MEKDGESKEVVKNPEAEIRVFRILNVVPKKSYTLLCEYGEEKIKKEFTAKKLKRILKGFVFSFSIEESTSLRFTLSQGKKFQKSWSFDFDKLYSKFKYRFSHLIEGGIEVRSIFLKEDHGRDVEDAVPTFALFSGNFDFTPCLRIILSFLRSDFVVKVISIVSKNLREVVMKLHKFNSPLVFSRGDINTITAVSNVYQSFGSYYIGQLFPHRVVKSRRENLNLISRLQIHDLMFPTNKQAVQLLQKLVIHLPSLDFLCFNIPYSFARDKPEVGEDEFTVRKYEEYVYPFQNGNRKVQNILAEKRKRLSAGQTEVFQFLIKPTETAVMMIHGYIFSFDFSIDQKSLVMFNDTENCVADVFCRLLLEDVDEERNMFQIPVLFTRDYLSSDEFRPYDSDDFKLVWRAGLCRVSVQFRFYNVVTVKEYKDMLSRGNPLEFDAVKRIVPENKWVDGKVTFKKEEFNSDFEGKYLATKEIELLGIKWCVECIGLGKDTFIHMYVSPNLYGELVMHYKGPIHFKISNKFFRSVRDSSVTTSGGIQCSADVKKDVVVDIQVKIEEVWENETRGAGNNPVLELERVMAHEVGTAQSVEVEMNSFYGFEQHFLKLLGLGWIFTVEMDKEKGDLSVAIERGFDFDLITPVKFKVELINKKGAVWKIDSILCFFTFKGQYYRYGKLPYGPFKEIADQQNYKVRLTITVAEKFMTKEEYTQSLQKSMEISKRFINQKFSKDIEVIVPEENIKSKLPFIVGSFEFAGIIYTCEFSPCRRGFVSVTLSHKVPFQSTLLKKEFELKFLNEKKRKKKKEEEEGEGEEEEEGEARTIAVKTDDSFIDFDQICPSNTSKKNWKFRISMTIKEISKKTFTLKRRLQK